MTKWLITGLVFALVIGFWVGREVIIPVDAPTIDIPDVVNVSVDRVVDDSKIPLVDLELGRVIQQPDVDSEAREDVEHEEVVSDVPDPASWATNYAAIEALRLAREQGDSRAPPIGGNGATEERPTDDELDDPALYLQYETRQQRQLYRGYVQASDEKIRTLKSMVERARAEGMDPEEIAVGEEKIRRIQAMKEELLRDNPGLMAVE